MDRAKFFDATRAAMSLANWHDNVYTTQQKSAEEQLDLQIKKSKLKRKRGRLSQEAANVFDEDSVQESLDQAIKNLTAAEQKMEERMKRRCPDNRFFSLGEENGAFLLPADPNSTRPTSELVPAEQGDQLKGVGARLAQDLMDDDFLANVAVVVANAIRPIRENRDGGTLTTMAQGCVAPQLQLNAAPITGEIHSVAFMELWLREADTTRGERSCKRTKHCEGAKIFRTHTLEGAPRALQEFLPFEERMQFYGTGTHSTEQPGECLLCRLMGVGVSWTLTASMLESQDYSDVHCYFGTLFNVPGEILKDFAYINPPGQFFGLLAPVVMFLPEMFQPVKRRGTEHLLALAFISECRCPETEAAPVQHFR